MKIKRDISTDLSAWKASKVRRPILLYGVRRSGKTTVLKEFGKSEFKKTVYFDLRKTPDFVRLFKGEDNPNAVIKTLKSVSGCEISSSDTLIVFDNIAPGSPMFDILHVFFEQAPEYFITGSVSEFYMDDGSLIVPEPGSRIDCKYFEVISMAPCTYEEYLCYANPYLFRLYEVNSISAKDNDAVMTSINEYLLSGGLPEVVALLGMPIGMVKANEKLGELAKKYLSDFKKIPAIVSIDGLMKVWGRLLKEGFDHRVSNFQFMQRDDFAKYQCLFGEARELARRRQVFVDTFAHMDNPPECFMSCSDFGIARKVEPFNFLKGQKPHFAADFIKNLDRRNAGRQGNLL